MGQRRSTSLALVAMLLIATSPATHTHAAEQSTITLGDDLFVSGRHVVVRQGAAGDMIVAGGDVQVQAPAAGDLVAAGRVVQFTNTARQDAYLAGSEVTVAGTVERNARLAGGTVIVAAPARIDGNISVAGGEVTIAGTVGGYVQAMGGRIFINGPVGGDVQLAGGEVLLGPQANIAGIVRYRSEEDIEQHPSARVAGGVQRLAAPDEEGDGALGWLGGIWGIGLMILAAVLVAVLPGFTRRSSQAATTRLGPTLLIGLAAVVFIPLLLFAALITVVGIPLALALLLIYLLLLLLGFVVAGIALGDVALRRLPPEKREKVAWRSLGAAIAVAVLVLVTFIPVVGGIVALLALVVGIGAMVTQLRTRENVATA